MSKEEDQIKIQTARTNHDGDVFYTYAILPIIFWIKRKLNIA